MKQTSNGSSHSLNRSSHAGAFRGSRDSTERQRTELGGQVQALYLNSLQIPERIRESDKVVLGRTEEALTLAERALAQDPASVLANRDKAIILYRARRYEECVEQCQKTLELDRYYVSIYGVLAGAYERLDRPQQAIEAYITPLTFSEENRDMVAALRDAATRGGLKGFWERRLQYLLAEPEVRTAAVAAAYVKIGDHDRAMAWLERLYAERGAWIRGLKVHPGWDPLRSDARFQALLLRAHLTPMPTEWFSQKHGPASPLETKSLGEIRNL